MLSTHKCNIFVHFFQLFPRPRFVQFMDALPIGGPAGAGAGPPGTGPQGEWRSGKMGGITPANCPKNKNSLFKTALKKSPKK